MQPERIGPYRIEGVLGSGGMGTVYAAYDERLDRRVAIKTIRQGSDVTPERRERLWREARATAALEHPAIARIYDVLGEGDDLHIVMERVVGRPVSDLLAEGPLPVVDALALGQQIAEGLAAAHARGIVHRDLKAANVMVTDEGRVKILDFGLAKRLDAPATDTALTQDGVVLGTCHAMSPEQAMGRPLDGRSDLFALGSLLYQTLTGQHPFAVPSPMATLHRIVQHRPPRADLLRPEASRAVGELVERLLVKEPERRPARAADVAIALAELRTPSAEVPEQATTITSHRPPWSRPKLTLTATAVAALAVATTLVAMLVLRAGDPPPRTVAVPAATTTGDADEGTLLAGRAVREAILGSVSRLERLAAVDPRTVDAASGDAVAVARAVAADEVVFAELEATDRGFRVTLRRIDGATGTMLWTGGLVEVPTHDLTLLADAVAARLASGYPDRSTDETRHRSIAEPEDYADYLRIEAQLLDPPPGVDEAELLDGLAAIRHRSPRLLEASLLEANTAAYLFETTGHHRWIERARQVVQEALRIAPRDPRPVRAAVEVAIAGRRPDEARRWLAELERLDPGSTAGLDLAARTAELEGDLDRAAELYRRLVSARPNWYHLRNAALIERRRGRVHEARELLTLALERAPGNRYVQSTLAEIELVHGDPERAARLYTDLLERAPSPVYRSNLGVSLMLAGRYDVARETFARALEAVPADPTTLLNLADCLELTGRDEAAEARYREARAAVQERPEQDVEALSVSGQVAAHLGERADAAYFARQLLVAAPEDPQVQFEVALIYALIGELDSAEVNAVAALDAGVNPRWFALPWFDPLRDRPAVAGRL